MCTYLIIGIKSYIAVKARGELENVTENIENKEHFEHETVTTDD